jgi:hemerythrin superfamily protein
MKDTIDALELLIAQHDEVDDLIDQIEDSDDEDERATLFRELADKIAAHAAIEEKLFYPSVVSADTAEMLLEATEEHLVIKRVLADLLEMEPDDDRFDAKLTVLKDVFRHHAREEEERELFPIVRRMMNADERAGMGNELLAMYEELIDQEPRMNVPAETREAAPLDIAW